MHPLFLLAKESYLHSGYCTVVLRPQLWHLCGTRQNLSTAFHPQSQGLVEHANRTLVEGLWHYLHGLYEEWESHVPAVEFAYNHSVHQSLGISPFEYLYGYNPRMPLTLLVGIQHTASEVSVFMKRLVTRIEAAHDRILQIQVKQAESLGARRSDVTYQKFTPKFLGPFRVLEVRTGGNAVKLELPRTMSRLHPVISVGRLLKFKVPDPVTGPLSVPQPDPVFEDSSGQYWAVEQIVAERTGRSGGRNVDLTNDCPEAIAHWQARQLAIPATREEDHSARHQSLATKAARLAAEAQPVASPAGATLVSRAVPASAATVPHPAATVQTRSRRVSRAPSRRGSVARWPGQWQSGSK
eukprot:3228461-Rhodomonas_salina.1